MTKGSAKGKGPPGLAGDKGKGKAKGANREESEALHAACQFDDEAALRGLLERGDRPLDPNLCLWRGLTPLHTAAVNNSIRATRALLEHGVRLTAVNSFGETPLHLAVAAGHSNIAGELVGARAELEAADAWGRTPLRVATENGAVAAAEALRSAGALDLQPVDASGIDSVASEVDEARRAQQRNLTREFMDRVHQQPPKGATAQEPVVRHIFSPQSGAAIGAEATHRPTGGLGGGSAAPNRALSKLVEYPGDPAAVARHLVDPSVDPNGRDMFALTAFHKFAAWDKVDLLELLSPHLGGDDVNAVGGDEGFSALHHAVSMGAVNTLSALLKDPRVSRDLKDRAGRTPRELAATTAGLESLASLFD